MIPTCARAGAAGVANVGIGPLAALRGALARPSRAWVAAGSCNANFDESAHRIPVLGELAIRMSSAIMPETRNGPQAEATPRKIAAEISVRNEKAP